MKRSRSRSPSYDRASGSGRSRSRSNDRRSDGSDDRRRSVSRRSDSRSDEEPRRIHHGEKIYVKLSDQDAAFLLGKGGNTKEKIARVSGACLELPGRSLTLEITGDPESKRRAKKYVDCVIAQRTGDVILDEDDPHFSGDCTIVDVPSETAGFVTGTRGSFLRMVEQEYGTLMFFVHLKGDRERERRSSGEKLAIFGPRRGRRGAELKVMAAIENKIPGHYTEDLKDHLSDGEDWGTDIKRLRMDEMSWALGKKGATRRKLANASGCIVEYVGNVVHMSGSLRERQRANEYLGWIMAQLDGPIEFNTDNRDDVTVLHIPQDCVGYVTGLKRATLARIEDEWGAFMLFMDRKEESRTKKTAKLAIFGLRRNRRGAELKVMSAVEGKEPKFFTRDTREGDDPADWGTDIYRFRGEELSYALGKGGTTKQKLAKAAACIMEYVGEYAYVSGGKTERRRGMRYLRWLLKQRSGPIHMDELGRNGRYDDVSKITIPKSTIPGVMGSKGSGLRSIEEETGTFLFMASNDSHEDVLLICSADLVSRKQAEHMVHASVSDVQSRDDARARGGGDRWHDNRGGGSYWDDWRGGGGRDRYDDRGPPSKYRRGDDYGYRGGGGGGGGYGGGYGGYDDRRGGYGGYDDRRGGGGYGRRSRSRSADSYDSRDSYDRRGRGDNYRDDYDRRDYDRRDRDRGGYGRY